jgi:hypothetical protein
MAEVVAAGVGEVSGAVSVLRRIPDIVFRLCSHGHGRGRDTEIFLPDTSLPMDELDAADTITSGTPARFRIMCG